MSVLPSMPTCKKMPIVAIRALFTTVRLVNGLLLLHQLFCHFYGL